MLMGKSKNKRSEIDHHGPDNKPPGKPFNIPLIIEIVLCFVTLAGGFYCFGKLESRQDSVEKSLDGIESDVKKINIDLFNHRLTGVEEKIKGIENEIKRN